MTGKPVIRCKVSRLVDDSDNVLSAVVTVDALGRATAKIAAASAVNGYWTEDTDCEIIEQVEEGDWFEYPRVVSIQ